MRRQRDGVLYETDEIREGFSVLKPTKPKSKERWTFSLAGGIRVGICYTDYISQ